MNFRNFVLTLTLLLTPLASADAQAVPRFGDVPRVVAMGDIHGDYHGMIAALSRAGLLDPEQRWDGGQAHLVVTGDMVDRGPDSVRVIRFLMDLQEQADRAGGRVHVLMGNHEAMVLTGDFRYVADEEYRRLAGEEDPGDREAALQRFRIAHDGRYPDDEALRTAFAKQYPPGFFALREVYSLQSEVGRWLAGRPVTVVVADTAFVHGGFAEPPPPDINERNREQLADLLGAWNDLIDAGMIAPEYAMVDAADALERALETGSIAVDDPRLRSAARTLAGARQSLAMAPDGPLWYRGAAMCNPTVEGARLQAAVDALEAKKLVVGHTPVPRTSTRLGGRLVLVDSDHEQGFQLLEIEDNRMSVLTPEGRVAMEPMGEHHPLADVPLSGPGIESFLREADVVSMEPVGTGVTNPQRVTLEKDGTRLRAVFKTEATPVARGGRLQQRRLLNLADRHQHELAAYGLDRMLGLDMVPPAVTRRIGREEGTLQLWVEDGTNERERRKQGLDPDPACPWRPQYDLMELFDRLIYNTDRTQENILYTRDWRLALIDHTRAFRTHDGKPEAVRQVRLADAPGFAERLAALDEDAVRSQLGDYLDTRQIRALLQRRDEMLAEWRADGGDDVASR